jgi:heme oxygenase
MIEIKHSGPNGLIDHLRDATRASHDALERQLNIFEHLADRRRIRYLLDRFYGFHLEWEAAIAVSECGAFAEARSRLALLEADLEALGRSSSEIAVLARCVSARELATTRAGVIGSLYVMEGSTLGGQLINRAIKATGWAPAHGLRYFNPYGKRTAERWREFVRWADAQLPLSEHEGAASAARSTFTLLAKWLV